MTHLLFTLLFVSSLTGVLVHDEEVSRFDSNQLSCKFFSLPSIDLDLRQSSIWSIRPINSKLYPLHNLGFKNKFPRRAIVGKCTCAECSAIAERKSTFQNMII